MACNCNTSDPNCEPCLQCTPPGVQCLPDCNPKEQCEDVIDLCCVKYSGKDEDCYDIKKGESLCDLFFDKILPKAFPKDDCCLLQISIDLVSIN
jgi:hypothetical protein